MIVNKRRDRADYCEWFLKNVKEEASAREMASYALEHNLVRNHVSIGSNELAGVMKTKPYFVNKRGYKRGSKVCIWRLDYDFSSRTT